MGDGEVDDEDCFWPVRVPQRDILTWREGRDFTALGSLLFLDEDDAKNCSSKSKLYSRIDLPFSEASSAKLAFESACKGFATTFIPKDLYASSYAVQNMTFVRRQYGAQRRAGQVQGQGRRWHNSF